MKVVLATELFMPGVSGMITSVRQLAEHLSASGHTVTLICPDSKPARCWARRCEVALWPVPGVTMPARIGQRVGLVRPASARILALLRNTDVVHLHSPFW